MLAEIFFIHSLQLFAQLLKGHKTAKVNCVKKNTSQLINFLPLMQPPMRVYSFMAIKTDNSQKLDDCLFPRVA